MQTRSKLNIALIGGLAVVALLFWLAGRDDGGATPLVERPMGAIETLSVRADGRLQWTLEHQADGWRVTAPLAAPARADRVRQLLQLLRAPIGERYSLEQAPPARFGLAEPALTIEVDGEALAVGDGEPVGRQRYVRRGDEVVLVNELVYYQFARGVDALLDNRLLPPDAGIARIRFPDHRLERNEAGRWALTPGAEAFEEGDPERLMENWRQAEARQVLAWPVPVAEPAEPAIVVELSDGRRRHFHRVDEGEGLTLACPETGLRYRFPAGAAAALLPPEDGDA